MCRYNAEVLYYKSRTTPLSFVGSGKYVATRVNRIPFGIVREILLHRAEHVEFTQANYTSGI